jgi:hypothetical protein
MSFKPLGQGFTRNKYNSTGKAKKIDVEFRKVKDIRALCGFFINGHRSA